MSITDKIFTAAIILNQISLVLLSIDFNLSGLVLGIAAIVLLFYGLLRGVIWTKLYNLMSAREK